MLIYTAATTEWVLEKIDQLETRKTNLAELRREAEEQLDSDYGVQGLKLEVLGFGGEIETSLADLYTRINSTEAKLWKITVLKPSSVKG